MDYIIAVILGIVEGVTEYLPVSSTGHMILVGDWLGFDGPRASVFEVFIQLGAILSVLVIYKENFSICWDNTSAGIYCAGTTGSDVIRG